MDDVLAKIVERKRLDIADLRRRAEAEGWAEQARTAPASVDFFAAMDPADGIRVIAEIKKASPSAGVLRPNFDPPAIARSYARNGAAAISVLTDEPFFQGRIEDLRNVRAAVDLPLLRKDFVLDEVQILQARMSGAAAVLLIAECLSPERLAELTATIFDYGMTPLVELYEPSNLPAVLASGTRLVGVNNRNLRTFETRLEHTLDLRQAIPSDRRLVSESGISTRADVERLEAAGVDGILVGETFMRADDPGAKLAELIGRTPTAVE
ncbi:MAG: indole-3-glycerol phosphate synthase TrpC [Planctomycetia bacterium]